MNNDAFKLDPVEYKEVRGKIVVEYTAKGSDIIFQVNIPAKDVKYWRNIGNKGLYERLISILRKSKMPDDIEVDIGSPTNVFDKVTVICHGLNDRPFSDSFSKDVAANIATNLY
jgi:5'-3' exonuclease